MRRGEPQRTGLGRRLRRLAWPSGVEPWARGLLGRGAATCRSLPAALVDLLYPRLCALCSEPLADADDTQRLCAACRGQFELLAGPVCRRCAMPVRGQRQDQPDCFRCRRRLYRFQAAMAYGVYRGALRSAVIRAKRAAEEPLAYALGELLAEHLHRRENPLPFDLVVPIPTHWRKRWSRGGNGAEIIALALARRLGSCYDPGLLHARRATLKQGLLTPAERQRNVRRAFDVRGRGRLADARVLLVDDVLTTGATASEAAGALRRAGAASVTVAVVARGVGRHVASL